MQGEIQEINIRSLLQLLESEQKNGTLYVETAVTASQGLIKNYNNRVYTKANSSVAAHLQHQHYWMFFFRSGQIVYAISSNNQNLLRLKDYLHYYQLNIVWEELSEKLIKTVALPEYTCLIWLLQQQLINIKQGKTIIQKLIEETLFDLFISRPQKFIFKSHSLFQPEIAAFVISPLIQTIVPQVSWWKQLYPYIQSSQQYPVISDRSKLHTCLSTRAYANLSAWEQQQASLQQISRHLHRPLIQLAKVIYPYVKQGWVKLQEQSQESLPQTDEPTTGKKHQIVCVEHDMANCKKVDYILKQSGYNATIVTNSLQALSTILQLRPSLILCNANMPQLSSYELCSMLQQTQACQKTPIVILADQENFLEQVKFKLVSSADYLAKPFTKNELLMIIEKYLGSIKGEGLGKIKSPLKS